MSTARTTAAVRSGSACSRPKHFCRLTLVYFALYSIRKVRNSG